MLDRNLRADLAAYADEKAIPRWLVYGGALGILYIGDQSRVMALSLINLAIAAIFGVIGLLVGNGLLAAIAFLMLCLSLGVSKFTDLLYASKGASWINAATGIDLLTCADKDQIHKVQELAITEIEIRSVIEKHINANK